MNRRREVFLYTITILVFFLFFPHIATAHESGLSVQSGQISPQDAQRLREAVERGEISPEALKKLQKEGKPGALTPAEIEAGKKILEKEQEKALEKPAEPSKEKVEEPQKEEEARIEAEKKAEELQKKEEEIRIAPEKRTEEPSKEKELLEAEEEFFKKQLSEGLPALIIYGHELFSKAPSTFAPITAIPVSNDYVVGPGDEIMVLMWGRLDASYTLTVDSEGVINFPKIGPLTVAGLTFGELKGLIKLKAEAITGVNVNVSMGKLRTIQVFVLGEVKSPGVYTVSSLATIVNALLSSGGPTSLGSLRRIKLKRKGKVITAIDLYNFLLKGDTSKDIRLQPGDIIFVPQAGPMVNVSGNVKRPAIYELRYKRTLQTALRLAGGLAPRAYNQRIQIERFFKNQMQIVLDIPYEALQKKRLVPLQDGDIIKVFSILPGSANAIYLYGNVLRPGQYAYKPGLRLLGILPDLNSLAVDTYFDYALIKRYHPKDMQAELIPFDLGRLLISKDDRQNIYLQPLDEVYVFSKWMFEDRPYASVEGEVRKPGYYIIHDMKIKDLIQRAGDLTDEGYLPKGELIRTDKEQVTHTIYFDVAKAMADDPNHNLTVQDRDKVIIHSIWEEQWREFVNIEGEVKNAGRYTLSRGMRLKDLFFKAGSFTRDAYMEAGHLYRTDWRTKEVTIHTFNVAKALAGDPENNIILKDLDRVVIHNIREYVPVEKVSIEGEIQKPGTYPYAKNMRIKDLILVARNITRDAFLEKGHLYRTDWRTKEVTIHTFNVQKALEGDPGQNLMLKELDRVVIHNIREYVPVEKVSIEGEIQKPGTYPFATNMRIKDLILVALNITRDAYLEMGHLYRTDWRTKEVTIHTFQLKKALEGDPEHNLLLEDLDSIVIHSIWEYVEKNIVTIEGMVNKPGDYPYATNMTIRDLIIVAGNVKYAAYMKTAEVIRYDIVSGEKVKTSVLNFDVRLALRKDPAHNLKLNPQDVVYIKEIPEWGEKKAVTILGEVNFPGTYPVRKDERLSSVIERAGGYTEEVYLRGGVFTRESVRIIQQDRLNTMMKRLELEIAGVSAREAQSALSEEDLAAQALFVSAQKALLAELKEAKATGRVVIFLKPLDTFKGTPGDLIMEDADKLYIPQEPTTINVLGAVYNPTALVYDKERSRLKDYLAMVGGPTKNAEEDHMYIIRANGTVVSKKGISWFVFGKRFKNIILYPGDTLLVPQKVVRPSYLRDVKDITQILYQIAITTGVIVTLF